MVVYIVAQNLFLTLVFFSILLAQNVPWKYEFKAETVDKES